MFFHVIKKGTKMGPYVQHDYVLRRTCGKRDFIGPFIAANRIPLFTRDSSCNFSLQVSQYLLL